MTTRRGRRLAGFTDLAFGVGVGVFSSTLMMGQGLIVEAATDPAPSGEKTVQQDIANDQHDITQDRQAISQLDQKVAQEQQTVHNDLTKLQRDQQGFRQQLTSLETQRAEALKSGNTAKADALHTQIEQLRQQARVERKTDQEALHTAQRDLRHDERVVHKDDKDLRKDERDLAKDQQKSGAQTSGPLPPGLEKQGKRPHGLEKQGKTPEGWSHGKAWWKHSGQAPSGFHGGLARSGGEAHAHHGHGPR